MVFLGVVLSTEVLISASVYSRPKRLLSVIFFRAAKMFSARLLLTRSLTILGNQVYEVIACVRRANENVGNLISVVQFLIRT